MKSEVILYTGLSTLQKKLYKAILTKDLGEATAQALRGLGPGVEFRGYLQLLLEQVGVRRG